MIYANNYPNKIAVGPILASRKIRQNKNSVAYGKWDEKMIATRQPVYIRVLNPNEEYAIIAVSNSLYWDLK